MNPGRVFAVMILLLAGALLVQGYLIPALFTAVFGVLVFAAPHVRAGGSNDEGAIGDAGASSWPSGGGYDSNRCNDDNTASGHGQDRDTAACDPGDAGGDSGGDGGGDCSGGDSGGGGGD